jgi:hypothetical protein
MPRRILEKHLALAQQRLSMLESFYQMVSDARSDYCPWMSDAEFAETAIIIKRIADRHLRGEMPTESMLSRLTGIPRQTLHRKLMPLVKRGVLVRDGHRFAIAPEYFNKPQMIAGFRRRLLMLRETTDVILQTVDWRALAQHEQTPAQNEQ